MKLFLLNHQKCVDTNHGVFQKEETKGNLKTNLKKNCFKYWIFVNKPGNYLKLQHSCNYPQHTPTPHPQEDNSFISFYSFTVPWYLLTCGNFLNTKTYLKWLKYLFYNFIGRTYFASRCTPWWHWPICVNYFHMHISSLKWYFLSF